MSSNQGHRRVGVAYMAIESDLTSQTQCLAGTEDFYKRLPIASHINFGNTPTQSNGPEDP